MHSHRPWIALDDLQHALAFRQGVEFPQHERMRYPQHARKGAAVTRNPQLRGDEQAGLYRRQLGISALRRRDEGKKAIDLGCLYAHAAFRRRKDTMIDFEVGVSLSLPALPSGTSTFSSG